MNGTKEDVCQLSHERFSYMNYSNSIYLREDLMSASTVSPRSVHKQFQMFCPINVSTCARQQLAK